MIYIIMCGGKYHRWKQPRQLIEIGGEPIVARTIRLLKAAGVDDIAISTADERFEAFGVPILKHGNDFADTGRPNDGLWVSAFYPTNNPACYIMGDVVFSPKAIDTIVSKETTDIDFFASSPPFPRDGYIKRWAEPFAFKVVNQVRFRAAIDYISETINMGLYRRHPIAWELWQVINKADPNVINYKSYTAINDYTCDIDTPDDVAKIEAVLKEWQEY